MNNIILLIGFSLALSSFECFGQTYELIYDLSSPTVQNKMNDNKMSGVDILSGIKTKHIIGFSGIGIVQKDALTNLLENESTIITYTISEDLKSLILETQAIYTKEDFVILLSSLNGQITGYNAEYSLYKQ